MERSSQSGEFRVTDEGAKAAVFELQRRVEENPQLNFINELKRRFPSSKVYLVGGIVRDCVMGVESDDYDFVIEGIKKEELEEYLLQAGSIVTESDTETAVFKYKPKLEDGKLGEIYDIAIPRSEVYEEGKRQGDVSVNTEGLTIDDDLSRRDLTINSIALRLGDDGPEIVDPYGGIEDINKKEIRAVGDPEERFLEDPLRMLRAVRFANRFGFEIEQETKDAIIKLGSELNREFVDMDGVNKRRVPYERFSKEIKGALNADPERFLKIYDETGLLEQVLPEVAALKGVSQPKEFHLEGDAFEHTKLAMKNLPEDASLELKFAAMLHDLGKPETFEEVDGRIRFLGHAELSASIADRLLKRISINQEMRKKVVRLVADHMKPLQVFDPRNCELDDDGKLSKLNKGQRRLLMSEDSIDLLSLSLADAKASIRDKEGSVDTRFYSHATEGRSLLSDEKKVGRKVEIINGKDIIKIIKEMLGDKTSIDPKKYGLVIGEIKTAINDLYADGEIVDESEARIRAKQLLNEKL